MPGQFLLNEMQKYLIKWRTFFYLFFGSSCIRKHFEVLISLKFYFTRNKLYFPTFLLQKECVNTNLYLTFHGNTEQGDEVHDQDRPEHWHIKQLKEGTAESNQGCLSC